MDTLRQGGNYSPTTRPVERDTLATRLAQINEELVFTEKVAYEAIQRLGIPIDSAGGDKTPPLPGLHGMAMEIGNRLARTKSALERVLDFLN